ncbi:DinB family protein [Sphingobacterium litopenaei]|uniref:DinB family protein n=1 Tax=Sphingobacterium litopenaei TaxID=2763500 RepID=A0ABR7YA16_9SPHI|nr:DinB family protein [Sphingobacterium litopenaei]MBD1428135.1 DinB family protein [Sphingobacterium litopenaei]
MKTDLLIQQLIDQTFKILDQGQKLNSFDLETLTWRPNESSWNILECIEHLNRYADYYLPEIREAIQNSNSTPNSDFKSSWLGNYFAQSMLPKDKPNKMKTFKSKNPIHQNLSIEVLDKFLNQQNDLINLLMQARYVNLNITKIKTSLSSLIRINLGDTFKFYINHIMRHLKQIENILCEYQLENLKPIY